MRQAGRYLPEYRKLRDDHAFLEVCHTPELARQVTLQPIDRFGMDAAIVFSDILLPFEGLGRPVRYEPGTGPVLDDPLRDPEAVDELARPDPGEAYPALAETIRAVREARPDVGVVGFAGAPFTLACYLVEGGSPGRYEHVHRFLHEHPDAFQRLLDHLADAAGDQLAAQADAGADAVQLFDTHAERLAAPAYSSIARDPADRALGHVDPGDAARIAFARGSHLVPELAGLDAEAISVDWRIDLAEAARQAPDTVLQGNLDPGLLQAPPARVAEATRDVLRAGDRAPGHVVNLGHGVTPNARLDAVEALVRTVKEAAG
jgi:uroporphyrinogen decarboxylase